MLGYCLIVLLCDLFDCVLCDCVLLFGCVWLLHECVLLSECVFDIVCLCWSRVLLFVCGGYIVIYVVKLSDGFCYCPNVVVTV